jgi:hypothetical protein
MRLNDLVSSLSFQITENLLFIGNVFERMGRDWQRERRGVE